MEKVKGGIVARDMLEYARELARIADDSACITVEIWCHRRGEPDESVGVEIAVFECAGNRRKSVQHGDVEFFDLRDAAGLIDEIRGELMEVEIIKKRSVER